MGRVSVLWIDPSRPAAAEHVHDAAQGSGAHRDADALARARDGEAAAQALRGAHCDCPHDAVAELLLHFERQVDIIELERVIDLGDLIAVELHVDDAPMICTILPLDMILNSSCLYRCRAADDLRKLLRDRAWRPCCK